MPLSKETETEPDVEVPVMRELWVMWNIPSLSSFLDPL